MAVRNLEAINRHGEMVAQQQANAKKLRVESFWNRVNIIRKSRKDAIDFVDTAVALRRNGLGAKFDEWMEHQIFDYRSGGELSIGTSSSGRVWYNAKSNDVCFGWSDYGMCESYSINDRNLDYVINRVLDYRKYNERLTLMAERLQPFLDAFFKWVETI